MDRAADSYSAGRGFDSRLFDHTKCKRENKMPDSKSVQKRVEEAQALLIGVPAGPYDVLPMPGDDTPTIFIGTPEDWQASVEPRLFSASHQDRWGEQLAITNLLAAAPTLVTLVTELWEAYTATPNSSDRLKANSHDKGEHGANDSLRSRVEKARSLIAAASPSPLLDTKGWPRTHRDGCCICCGNWTPAAHPETHDHREDCKAEAAAPAWGASRRAFTAAAPDLGVLINDLWAEIERLQAETEKRRRS